MYFKGVIMSGTESYAMLATLFVVITEMAVWLALYVYLCKRQKRLPFGKLRARAFKYLMRHTDNVDWRVRWATLCFGRATLCNVCHKKITLHSVLKEPLHPVRCNHQYCNGYCVGCGIEEPSMAVQENPPREIA